MESVLTGDDPRYRELFDVSKETLGSGGVVLGDLTPAMSALRDQSPVHHGALRKLLNLPEMHKAFECERDHYALFSFKLCERAFRENLLFSSAVYRESPGVQSFGNTILWMTGDEHRSYRKIVQPMFLPKAAKTWWRTNWVQEAVDALLDRLQGSERIDSNSADLNMELCARLPVHVVTRGIGMSGEDALIFREHLLRSTTYARHLPEAERMKSAGEVGRMLRELISARRETLGDDVVSGLIAEEVDLPDGRRPLTDEEIFGYCRLIMLAGGGTTWRQLGITLHALMTNYHFWEACRDDRGLIELAINESMRWMPTDPTFPRLMTEDVELEGVRIPAGARVDVCLGAANRDPARWHNPDAYDMFRPEQYHLGFGLGPHRCLGMNVAIQEMETAINGLMDRFPNMQRDPDAPMPELLGGLEMRGMSAVPVLLRT